MRRSLKLLSFLLFNSVLVFATGLSGDKTIGSGEDYENISAAVADLNNFGTDGHLRFIIKSGIYTERFTINNFTRVNVTDTVLFVSETGNPADVVIDIESSTLTNNFQLKLNGCEDVTFRGIKFKTTSDVYCNSIYFTSGASFNRIDNCVFEASKTVTSISDTAMVVKNDPSSSNENGNEITNNIFSGGGIGIKLSGVDINNCESGNKVIGNHFSEQVINASQITFNKNGKFEKNYIAYSGAKEAAVFLLDSIYEISGNRIFCSPSSAAGIFVSYHDWLEVAGKDTLFIVNNMVSCGNGSALKAQQIKRAIIAHNTFYNESVTFYTLAVDQVDWTLSVNNLLVNNANNGAVQFTNDGSFVGSDYNGVYTGDGSIGLRDDGVKLNLAAWQASDLSPDPNSFFGPIIFDDPTTDLVPICGTSRDFFFNVNYLPQLNKDINGKVRDPAGFWIGAAEFGHPRDHTIDLTGYITNGTDTIKDAIIEVYADTSSNVMLDLILTDVVDAVGSYNFGSIQYAEGYWMKIIPQGIYESDYVKAYHNGELRWDEGGPMVSSDSCGAHEEDIYPRKLASMPVGTYSIEGTITSTSGTGKTLGTDPIPGLDVVLDRIPPSKNTVAVTQTDEFGNYVFDNLPDGIFVVTIDYEGLPADTMYEIELGEEMTDAVEKDYCVDTLSKIGDCSPPVESVLDIQLSENVYPNPVNDVLNVTGINGEFNLLIYDVSGKILYSDFSLIGNQKINFSEYSKGTYLIRLVSKEIEQSIKIIK